MRSSLLTVLVLIAGASACADTYVVRPDGTGDFPTIQAAIDACVDGDVVELTDGTFTGDGNRDMDYLGKAITVRSRSGDPEACVIDCEGSQEDRHRGFNFRSGEGFQSALEGVTITNGYHSYAGAICCESSSPTITNCVLAGNRASPGGSGGGGGILAYGKARPQITGSVFRENIAPRWGGGLGTDDPASVILEDCEFTDNEGGDFGGAVQLSTSEPPSYLHGCAFQGNSADCGGAIQCWLARASIVDCSFLSNSASSGGAVDCQESCLTIERCMFESNSGYRGGAVCCDGYAPPGSRFVGCTFVTNTASARGGGAALLDCSPTFVGCTLSGNAAAVEGGGFYLWGAESVIENTIIAFGGAGEAVLLAQGATAMLSCCDLYGNAGGDWAGGIEDQLGMNGNIAMHPRFCGDANPGEPYTLWSHSPCAPFTPPNPECDLLGAWPVGCHPQDVEPHLQESTGLHLSANVPNPFSSATRIIYRMPATPGASRAILDIYDPRGRLVRSLVGFAAAAGNHFVMWDGTDSAGESVSGGVYFCRLAIGDQNRTRRLVLIR